MTTLRKYTVLAVLTLQAGVHVELSGEQAARRAHLLKPLEVDKRTGAGVYEVLAPTQFKVGEQLATDAVLNKALVDTLEPVEVTREKDAARRKAAAEAKALTEVRAKAKAWDDAQGELAQLRTIAAAWATLSEPVRTEALAAGDTAKKAK